MVQDIYNPNISTTNFGEKLSDFFGGTNYSGIKEMINNYELQKAININKYDWNKKGMIASGINPLVGSSNLNSVSQSQATYKESGLGFIEDLIKFPFEIIKSIVSNIL